MTHRTIVLAGVAVLFQGSAWAAQPSLCSGTESVVFSCATGDRIVSVCASAGLSARSGSLAYRFGPAGKPEISLPSAEAWRTQVGSGTWAFSRGGGAWLAFHRAGYRYIVYTAIGDGWGSKAGVAVEKDGKVIANLPCAGKPVSDVGPDFFQRAGIGEDPREFELP